MSVRVSALLMAGACLVAEAQGPIRPPMRRPSQQGQGAAAGLDQGQGRRQGQQQQQGQTPGSVEGEPAALNPEDYGSVQGTVVDIQTGQPLKKAEVTLLRGDGRNDTPDAQSATTGADGAFQFVKVAPGRYSVRVQKTGYVGANRGTSAAASRGMGSSVASLTLNKGENVRDFAFKMQPHGVISGRVLDDEGEPVARVQVQAQRYVYQNGQKRLMPLGMGSTNDLGEYRIWGVAPGTYFLAATPMDFNMVPRNRPARDGHATTYFPSSLSVDRANPLQIAAGSRLENVDVRMMRAHMVTVSGIVMDAAKGEKASRAQVTLTPNGDNAGEVMMMAMRGGGMARNGAFTLQNVTAGSYTLTANVFGEQGGRNMSIGTLQIDVGNEDIKGLTVVAHPGATVTGKVKYEGTDTAPASSNLRVVLESQRPLMMMGMTGSQVGADGKIELSNVAASKFRVRVSGMPEGYYVKEVKLGNQDVRQTGLDFSNGVAGELEITLAPGAGTVSGVVKTTKDETQSNAVVVLVPKTEYAGLSDQIRNTITGTKGEYTFAGVAPGDYDVYVFEDIEPGAWADPEVRLAAKDSAKSVKVDNGAAATLELKLPRS
ncbi:hypothetical protein F183_A42650 [Bryobacterales bacterium F-183]|nr:hypothetical protein F183_A42650 [Bryobacterales bacterium F-183]